MAEIEGEREALDILYNHRATGTLFGTPTCTCGERFDSMLEHEAHVARAIAAGLRRTPNVVADQTEREVLAEQDRLDISAVVHQNYHMPDVFAVVERIIARHHTPTPHVVTTAEEHAVRMKVAAEIRHELKDRVRNDPPSPLTEEEKVGWRHGMAYAERIARGDAVLTPAPAPVGREALEAVLALHSVVSVGTIHRADDWSGKYVVCACSGSTEWDTRPGAHIKASEYALHVADAVLRAIEGVDA